LPSTLFFFADYYLGENEQSLRSQQFHLDNPEFFRDYEELQPRKQHLLYEKPSIMAYLGHCRRKASETIAAETAATLAARCGFRG
jgi:hypothetical protein